MNKVSALEHLIWLTRFCVEEALNSKYFLEERDQKMHALMERLLIVALEMEAISESVTALLLEDEKKY